MNYAGHECQRIPIVLANSFGKHTKRLDLSFNSLTTLEGLESFLVLEELILDNNSLNDGVNFCYLPLLNTLSLNNNKVFQIIINRE